MVYRPPLLEGLGPRGSNALAYSIRTGFWGSLTCNRKRVSTLEFRVELLLKPSQNPIFCPVEEKNFKLWTALHNGGDSLIVKSIPGPVGLGFWGLGFGGFCRRGVLLKTRQDLEAIRRFWGVQSKTPKEYSLDIEYPPFSGFGGVQDFMPFRSSAAPMTRTKCRPKP